MRKTRKALALLISGMLALAIPFQAAAGESSPADAGEAEAVAVEQEEAYVVEEPETSGMCGDNLLWEYGEGTLLISGTGPMYDYSLADGTYPGWQAFGEQIERIDIESGLTVLDLDAFSGLPGLREVWYGGSAGEWSMIPQEGEQASVDEAVFDNVEITFAVQDEEEEDLSEDEIVTEEEDLSEDEAVTEEEGLSEDEAVTEEEGLSEDETVAEEEGLSEDEAVTEEEELSEDEAVTEEEELSENEAAAEEEELSENEAAAEEEDLQETGALSEKEAAEPAGSQTAGDTVPEGTPADAGTEKDELTAGGTEESVSQRGRMPRPL